MEAFQAVKARIGELLSEISLASLRSHAPLTPATLGVVKEQLALLPPARVVGRVFALRVADAAALPLLRAELAELVVPRAKLRLGAVGEMLVGVQMATMARTASEPMNMHAASAPEATSVASPPTPTRRGSCGGGVGLRRSVSMAGEMRGGGGGGGGSIPGRSAGPTGRGGALGAAAELSDDGDDVGPAAAAEGAAAAGATAAVPSDAGATLPPHQYRLDYWILASTSEPEGGGAPAALRR